MTDNPKTRINTVDAADADVAVSAAAGDVQVPRAPATYVSFSAGVDRVTAEGLIDFMGKQVEAGVRDIHLLLSTSGGKVREGVMLYNMLRAMPITLTTHNVSSVNSVGNAVFLAGRHRYACRASSFMFHGVGMDISNRTRLEEADVKAKLDSVQNDQGVLADIISDRAKIDADEAKQLFLRAAFLRGEEAREKGLIHEIREVSIPDGAPFFQLSFK